MNREREIVKASIYGIAGNALLVAFKMAVGFMSHSIAIILDGVNNATDALSSIVTIVGTKLAGRRPDRHHPFGYGRVEYLTSVVIAIIILVAGFISLRESIDKIIHPGTPSYSAITITVIVVAILAKIAIGIMFKRFGDKTNSEALIASGIDSNYDAVLSAGTLVVAAAQNFWNLNIDGAVGLIISLVVLKAGFEVLGDALSPLIGGPEDKKLVDDITVYANSFPDVRGTYDVVLDNFGPQRDFGLGAHRSARRYVRPRHPRPHPPDQRRAHREVRHPHHRGHLRRQHDRCVRPSACRPRRPREKRPGDPAGARLLRGRENLDRLLRFGHRL